MAALRAAVLSLLLGLVLVIAPSAGAIVDGDVHSGAGTPVVFVGQNTTPPRQACTGVAVSPTLILTAAHCGLLLNGTAPGGQTFTVFKGPSVRTPGHPPALGVFVPHPDFSWGGSGVPHFADNDLAVIRLVHGTVPGPYAKLPELGLVDTLRGAPTLDLYGYGVSNLVNGEADPMSFGTLRHARGKLLGGGGNSNFLHFNGSTCFGDSGGGVYYGNVVLGVVSFAPSGCHSTNYATRLDTESARSFLSLFGL